MVASGCVLPYFSSLKITNMTTFPQDLRISFDEGINVIFGGNHSGKTTIVNSIKYGVFGLSWNQAVEGVEKRYFSQRIKEINKKSLEISAVYNLESKTTTVNRTVFSSGTAEIEAFTHDSSKELSLSPAKCIRREKDYYEALRQNMKVGDIEQLRFLANLIFADESRQFVLWTKSLEDLVLNLIVSPEIHDRLLLIESQLNRARKDLDKIFQDKEQLLKKNSERKRFSEFLNERLKENQGSIIEKYVEEYKTAKKELEDYRIKRAELNEALQNKLNERSKLQTQLNDNQKYLLDLEINTENLDKELVKAFLNPDDPKKAHFGRYFYYEKKCPFCSADLSYEISSRVENKKCPICGKGELIDTKVDMETTGQKLKELDEEKKKMNKLNCEIQKDLQDASKKIEALTRSLDGVRAGENDRVIKINEFNVIEENLQKKDVMAKELSEIQDQINFSEKTIAKLDTDIKTIEKELEQITQLQDKTKTVMKSESSKLVGEIRKAFSKFVNTATNGELSAELSQDFIPVLSGRSVFDPEQSSQFERTLMDIAFRVALLSTLAEITNTKPSLVLETPDEVTDEAYVPYLVKAILTVSSSLSIIVTTVNSAMMKQFLEGYNRDDKKGHLINLVSKGTLTQRRFYELPLQSYLGGK